MEKPGSTPIDELIRLAIIGDGSAFTKLWDTHINSLKAFIKSQMKDLDDFYVGDICSRSFEKAFRQIRSYDPSISQFSTWLKTIAYRTALDTIDSENKIKANCVVLNESMTDEVDSPLESIIRNEDREKVKTSIEGLPELYREVAMRRLIDGLQYKEIAEELDLELNTVRTRIRRAKALIDSMQEDNS